MAFCFKRKESIAKAARRLGCERIECALAGLKEGCRAEAIHEARKDIKKVRAVIRLVRTGITKKTSGRLIRLLRKAARLLAAPRDASVNVLTLGKLTRRFGEQLPPRGLGRTRGELRAAAAAATHHFETAKVARRVRKILREVRKELDDLEVSGKGWNALSAGVEAAYRHGQRAYLVAREDPSPANFHEWRKRAKDLWYQVSLLEPVSPAHLAAMARRLETLGEHLGNDHDLVVLREAIEGRPAGAMDERELGLLRRLIEERHGELRARALALGSRFYAEESAIFCDRLAGFWHTWRDRKRSRRRAAQAAA